MCFVTIVCMMERIREYCTVVLVVLVLTIIVWLPFLLKSTSWYGIPVQNRCVGMNCILQNFDGPYYIVVAKSFYNREVFNDLRVEIPLKFEYYAAHLPLYPFIIFCFSYIFGYLKSGLFVTVLSTILLGSTIYYLLKNFAQSKYPLFGTVVTLIMPKLLIVDSIIAPESLFISLILLSLIFFEKKHYVLAGMFGALSVLTKIPGVILAVVYIFVFFEQFIKHKKIELGMTISSAITLLGLGILGFIYQSQMHDIFAYLHTGATVPMPYPFSVFNFQAFWVNDAWLEEIVLYTIVYISTILMLNKSKHRSFFYFALIFSVATSFVQHKDIIRYILPVWPLVIFAHHKLLESKHNQKLVVLIFPIILLYVWNFLAFNVAPISDWTSLR